jgi:hypothetical protein
MQQTTKKKILEEMVRFAKDTLPLDIDIGHLRRAFPFHAPFFTDEGLRAFKNQRSIVTRLGQSLIPRVAVLIASDKYSDVQRDYEIVGEADRGMVEKIREIVSHLRTAQRTPNAQQEWQEILAAASGEKVAQRVIADLYIGDFPGGPLFVEIKSPRPNLDICAETKEKILVFRAIMHAQDKHGAQGYFGLWYNPYIDRERYSHGFTRRVMDMDHEVLLGEEFWNKIGGPGTYDELLEVLSKAEQMIRQR